MAAAGNIDVEAHLKKLKHARRGKKGAITQRIAKIEELVGQSAGRRRIQILVGALIRVVEELHKVCDEINTLAGDDEYNDLEDVRAAVDDCIAMATEHLEARKDDPPSADSLTESWINRHMPNNFGSGSGSGSDKSGGSVNRVPIELGGAPPEYEVRVDNVEVFSTPTLILPLKMLTKLAS
jgi:hypothetical protein